MRSIFKFIRKTILYFCILIISYPLIVIFYGELVPEYFQKNLYYEKFAYGFSYTRFKEVKKFQNVDILFLGSSRSYRHYDPRIFKDAGFKTFNLGSSSQTFIQTEILVNRYLKDLNPKVVVLDIYSGMFFSDGVESSFDLISNDINGWDTFEMSLGLKNMMVLNTWIYAYYKELFFNSMKDSENLQKGTNNYISGGFVERKMTNSIEIVKSSDKWNFNKEQWESFTNIIEKLKKSNAQIFVVQSPKHGNFNDSNKKLTDYLESEDLKFYNFKRLKFLQDSLHFYDSTHLNQKGVDLYNSFFIKELLL